MNAWLSKPVLFRLEYESSGEIVKLQILVSRSGAETEILHVWKLQVMGIQLVHGRRDLKGGPISSLPQVLPPSGREGSLDLEVGQGLLGSEGSRWSPCDKVATQLAHPTGWFNGGNGLAHTLPDLC